ncbi:hypothetical protein FB451DRAFT_1387597 [Mycena latifolia]|nr:hypothetical protein FB451DRAFT_1387597 [Mycena latifolia]
MPKGQFNEAQNSHIHSFYPAYVKEMDKGVSTLALTRWKQATASGILDSPLFATLDAGIPRKAWFDMIVRKFTNYRHQVYLKSPEVQSSMRLSTAKKSNALLKFSSTLTGRQLFAQENHEAITLATKQRGLDTNTKNPAAIYQTILKERWDALSGEDQSHWNARADDEVGDIARNQEEFGGVINLALRDLCQGKLLGDAEMMLFYAFREPENGDLLAGTIHGHSIHNQQHFGGSREDLQARYGKPWSDFAENVIPRPVILNPAIPRNAGGQPVFPSIDLNSITITDLRVLLCDYFEQCWANRTSTSKVIAWEDLLVNPEKHYDAAGLHFSIKLDHPQNLSTVEVLTLAADLLLSSVMESPAPFRFLNGEETVVVPATPSMVLPSPPPASPVNPTTNSSSPDVPTPPPVVTPPSPVQQTADSPPPPPQKTREKGGSTK